MADTLAQQILTQQIWMCSGAQALTWTFPPGVRQAVESPQWNLPLTACTSVSMEMVVVLASSLQARAALRRPDDIATKCARCK